MPCESTRIGGIVLAEVNAGNAAAVAITGMQMPHSTGHSSCSASLYACP